MINVVKIGGGVIDDAAALAFFLRDFASLPGKKILVHGGGREATRLCERMDIPAVMIEGRRVTDSPTLDIVTMVYAGLINKRIVAMLQSIGCDAIGFSGADGNLIPATRRSPVPVDYGYVGDINSGRVNSRLLELLLANGNVPVCCAICHDEHGELLNCNADSVAAALARGLSYSEQVRLTYCFEKPGVMLDPEDESTVIPEITPGSFAELKADGVVSAGMIPKIQNALECVANGVCEVRICRASALGGSVGTVIRIK